MILRNLLTLVLICVILTACGTKILIEKCDSSLIFIEQSSEQKTDNRIPVSLSEGIKALEGLATLPTSIIPKIPEGPDIVSGEVVEIVPQSIESDIIEPQPIELTVIESHSMKPFEDKSQAWLNKTGSSYTGPILVKFNKCGEFTVKNPSLDFLPAGRNGHVWFADDPHNPGNMNGRGAVFTPKGCVATAVEIIQLTGD